MGERPTQGGECGWVEGPPAVRGMSYLVVRVEDLLGSWPWWSNNNSKVFSKTEGTVNLGAIYTTPKCRCWSVVSSKLLCSH